MVSVVGSLALRSSRNMTIWKSGLPTVRSLPCPTITLEGDANGAPHPDASSYAKKFSGKYVHRIIEGGVGHNLPQEAPQAFAKAIVDVEQL
jgi:pimeloyl-ACP methyl ester carboxylesterase